MPGRVIAAKVTKPVFHDPEERVSMAEPVRTSPLAGLADADALVAGGEPVTLWVPAVAAS